MQVISIPSNTSYSNLNTLTGYAVGSALVLTNNTSQPLFLVQSASTPTASSAQYPVLPGQTVMLEANVNPYWIRGGTGPVIVQLQYGSISPYSVVDLPDDVYTSSVQNFRRMRVDTGQTGFYEGREFRTFFEFNIPSGNVQVFKFVSPIDFMLFEQTLTVDAGSIRFQALIGATEVATFNTSLPVIGKNRMAQRKQPYYTPVITITTHAAPVVLNSGITGGTVVENVRIVATNATAQQQTVSGGAQSERGLPIGTYYLRLHNFGSGAATGVYSLFWEERPV